MSGHDIAFQVIDTVTFGKTLILDDHTQSSAVDEHPYHETLVHPGQPSCPRRRYAMSGTEIWW